MIYGFQFNLILGHKYDRKEWSKEINELKFGKCTSPHGHNYTLSIALEGGGPLDFDLNKSLTRLNEVFQETLAPWDHQFIDSTHADFLGMIPTTEILTKVIAQKIQPLLPESLKLKKIRIQEGTDIIAEGHF